MATPPNIDMGETSLSRAQSATPTIDSVLSTDFIRIVSYLQHANQLPTILKYKEGVGQLLKLKKGARVLDVGCGCGIDTVLLRKLVGAQGSVVGMDLSEVVVKFAQQTYGADADMTNDLGKVEFYRGDAYQLHKLFEQESFDAIRVDRVLQHLDDPAQVIKNCAVLLKPNGRLVIAEPEWRTLTFSSLMPMDANFPETSQIGRELDIKVAATFRNRIKNPDIGSQLPHLLSVVTDKNWKLDNTQVEPYILVERDDKESFLPYEEIIKSCERNLKILVSKERTGFTEQDRLLLLPDEYKMWMDRRKISIESNSFMCLLTMVTLSATKSMIRMTISPENSTTDSNQIVTPASNEPMDQTPSDIVHQVADLEEVLLSGLGDEGANVRERYL